MPAWKFEYYDPDLLPSKYSKKVDWWGYPSSSGVSMTGGLHPETLTQIGSLLPQVEYNAVTYPGSERAPDPTGILTRRGLLKKMTYPIGGYTEFFFEPNVYPISPVSKTVCQTLAAANNMGNNDPNEDIYTAPFSANGEVKVAFSAYPTYADPPVSSSEPIAWLKDNNGVILQNFYLTDPEGTVEERTLNLASGQYILEVAVLADHSIQLGAQTCHMEQVTSKAGAGLRINKISDHDPDGRKLREKRYIYTQNGQPDGISSGWYSDYTKYSEIQDYSKYYWKVCNTGLEGAHWSWEASATFLARSSSSLYPLGFNSQTGIVGYGVVHELIGENGEGGRIVYNFRAVPWSQVSGRSLRVGDIKRLERYNGAGDLISREDYYYTTKKLDYLLGFDVEGHWRDDACASCFLRLSGELREMPYNVNWSEWLVLDSIATTHRMSTGDILSVQRYHYDDPSHKMVTSSLTTNSDGTLIERFYKRPNDFVALLPYSDMVDKHIISPVVKTEERINGTFLQSKMTNYQNWGNNIFRPVAIESKTRTSDSETRIRYHEYDDKGNVVSMSREFDQRHSYLWDYDQTYPVAEAIVALPDQIAYSSFETSNKGNWIYGGMPVNNIPARTGSYAYKLQDGAVSRVLTANKYRVECFANELPTLSGVTVLSSRVPGSFDINGWGLYTWEIEASAGATLTISSNSPSLYIDALRLYPFGAQMTTYTYDRNYGITSATDTNGVTVFYEYDHLGRLITVKDDKRNILKKYTYNYYGD